MRPLVLPPNPVPRFYRGGACDSGAARDRGTPVSARPRSGSARGTTVFGERGGSLRGLSPLADGRLLRGRRGLPTRGTSSAQRTAGAPTHSLLVKLLDAGERLPVHVHPDAAFVARRRSTPPYGKTEAWIAH